MWSGSCFKTRSNQPSWKILLDLRQFQYSEEYCYFVSSLLEVDPRRRPTAHHLLKSFTVTPHTNNNTNSNNQLSENELRKSPSFGSRSGSCHRPPVSPVGTTEESPSFAAAYHPGFNRHVKGFKRAWGIAEPYTYDVNSMKRQETRDKRQETRDKRQETRDKRQEREEGKGKGKGGGTHLLFRSPGRIPPLSDPGK